MASATRCRSTTSKREPDAMPHQPKPRSPLQAIRHLLVSAPYAEVRDLRGKTAIVTGTAVGSIGYETASTLARWGAKVIITSRSAPQPLAQGMSKALQRDGINAVIDAHPLDLSQAASVETFANWYRNTHGDQLDILINNAGIHLDLLSQWKTPHLTEDGHELHWRTNYLGTMHLTHLLLPLLQNAGQRGGDARVVNVVSQLHTKGVNADLFAPSAAYNSWVAYGTSKLGLVHACNEIQRRFVASDHVQAYCLHPGAVFTNIADKGLNGNPTLEALRKSMAPIERFFLLTPEEGAQTQIHCASHPELAGGLYYQKCQASPSSAESHDAAVSARLWDATSAWVKTLA